MLDRPSHLTEIMDDPDVSPADLALSLRFIRHVNRYLGGTSAILTHLQAWSKSPSQPWPKNKPITILDIATGSADIPQAILRWAATAGFTVHILALDLHPTTLSLARQWTSQETKASASLDPHRSSLLFLRADALRLPLASRSIDYALCSMFLHHLTADQALQVIAEMLRVTRPGGGLVVNDLLRSPQAKLFIRLLTLFAPPIDKHDARVSVAKAWTKPEVQAWARQLNAPHLRYRSHLFGRFTLAGQNPASPQK